MKKNWILLTVCIVILFVGIMLGIDWLHAAWTASHITSSLSEVTNAGGQATYWFRWQDLVDGGWLTGSLLVAILVSGIGEFFVRHDPPKRNSD
jgi:hypothetical protein